MASVLHPISKILANNKALFVEVMHRREIFQTFQMTLRHALNGDGGHR